jgi:serine/threonine protein kinase
MNTLIDSGTFGNIYKCDSETVIKESSLYDDGYNWQSLKELLLLSQYKSRALVNLKKFEIVDNSIKLIIPHLNINLDYFMETFTDDYPEDDFTPDEFKEFIAEQKIEFLYSFIYQVTTVLIFLHGNGIIHNDLKPSNIMIDNNDNITVIDLGSALVSDVETSFCTSEYRSPETYWYNKTGFHSDIWALGLICLFIINDYNLMDNIDIDNNYTADTIDQKISAYLRSQSTFPSLQFHSGNLHKDTRLSNLISRMLIFEPRNLLRSNIH